MKNIIKISVLLFIISCNVSKNKAVIHDNIENTIPFTWEVYKVDNKSYTYGAIMIPFKFSNISKNFEMQLDLGSNYNLIYENSLNKIAEKYIGLNKNLHPIGDEGYKYLDTHYNLGNYSSNIDTLIIYPNFGSDNSFDSLKLIGSIGFNEFANKLLEIDYPKNELRVYNNSSEINEEEFYFQPIIIENNKIFITIKLNEKPYKFLFDTGAGIVPIVTVNKEFYDKATLNSKIPLDTIQSNSWGNDLLIYGAESKMGLLFGSFDLNKISNAIYYTNDEKQSAFFNEVNANGSIGNIYFINNVILLDLKNKRFGIKK